ncbi:MAG: hypothetical protein WC623_24490 [Pedobacter sp.]|uniref:hypothetical protein n=1 Tax=Pedobacter sp. TaxID=1411316 RepID=UPI0035612F84
MKILDLHNEVSVASLYAGTALLAASPISGTGVDIRDYQGVLKVILDSGAGGGTTPTLDAKLQDSANNTTFADITGKAFTQVTTAVSLQSLAIDTRAVRRYLRIYITITGTGATYGLAVTMAGQVQRI